MDVYQRALEIVRSRLLDQKLLQSEFRHVALRDESIDFSHFQSELPINKLLNRYCNVLFDNNRVILGKSRECYVNASHLSLSLDGYVNASSVSCSLDGSAIKPEDTIQYIASQGPLPSTVESFWRFVYEQKCPCILMLTNIVERGAIKCAEYCPKAAGQLLQFPSVKVTTIEVRTSLGKEMTVRKIEVRSGHPEEDGESPLTVNHFLFHQWPDHGVPEDSTAIRSMMRDMDTNRDRSVGPPVVHCSAGIGRTGTFIAIDTLRQRLKRLAAALEPVDSRAIIRALGVPDLVFDLRRQRMGSVQTFEQYCFIYYALFEEISKIIGKQ